MGCHLDYLSARNNLWICGEHYSEAHSPVQVVLSINAGDLVRGPHHENGEYGVVAIASIDANDGPVNS